MSKQQKAILGALLVFGAYCAARFVPAQTCSLVSRDDGHCIISDITMIAVFHFMAMTGCLILAFVLMCSVIFDGDEE